VTLADVRQLTRAAGPSSDVPPRSPWIAQLAPDGPPRPLRSDVETDVLVVGAGIAGVATAFFVLRDTPMRVLLVERDRVGRGATGRNAGQLTTYFERPLASIAAEFGEAQAVDAQRAFDDAHDLLDLMAAEAGATGRVERFIGHMAMFTLNHVTVHLRNNLVRRRGGLRLETCVISDDAEFLDDVDPEFDGLYTVVPQARINELLEVDNGYRAVLSDRKGCANGALLVQQVLAYLEGRYPDRFRYADHTQVARIRVGDGGVRAEVGDGHRIRAGAAVLCTNGFIDHEVVTTRGDRVELQPEQRVTGTIGYMAAFVEEEMRVPAAMSYIRNTEIGGPTPYVYVTRRTYDRADDAVTLTCMGGPEWPADHAWTADEPFPGGLLAEMDATVRPYAQPRRPAGRAYDFQWHGLMGYTGGMIRVIGRHPRYPELLYNLGCNGVGFLPSIHGGQRIARTLAGEAMGPSIFDPR
jgi:glycine/D-amino acid oxidase-like deaminating enzyme